MNTKIYAEIGLRSTPQSVLDALTQVATKLRKEGWVLRNGSDARGGFSVSRPERTPRTVERKST
jgi:hypothetical protein